MTIQDHIKNYILSNLVQEHERKIGVELECIFYDKNLKRIPVNPCDRFSATDFLKALDSTEIINEKGASTSLEPGGQIEWGSTPFVSLHDIYVQLEKYMSTLFEIVSQHELFFVDYAIDPLFTPDDIELIDLKKYELMRDRYEKIGGRGQWMMRCSSSVQVNIDITSESDAEEMAFIADCITPIVSLLFSNSPFVSGLPSGKDNLRYCIWNDTDPPRTGSLLDHGINSSESLLEKVCSFIPTVPAIFIIDKDNNYDSYNGSLGEWLESLEASGQLDRKDILTVLHQIFTHVRFKNVIEVRGMDRPPRGFEMAPVAFWTGILMAQESRDVILDIVGNWTVADRIALEKMAAKIEIYQLGPNGKTIEEWLYTFCDIALKGLKMRSEKFKWENEDRYLSPYLDIIKSNGIITLSTQNDFKKSGLSLRSFLIERKANA